MSESSASRSVTWTRNAAPVLAAILAAACVDDSVAPGTQTVPDARGPSVISFVEVSLEAIGTPNQTSSVLSAPSIAALEELRAERERLRESGEDVALQPTMAGDGTIQFGERTSNGTDEDEDTGGWYAHGTFDIRNADASGVPYPDERHNLTLQAISTPNNVNGTAIRQLTLSTPGTEDEVALRLVPSGRVTVVNEELVIVKPDVLQIVPENYIADLNIPGASTVFPYGFVVRTASDSDRTLQATPAPEFHEGEVDIAYSAPLADGENIESMSITFVALDYGLDDTFVTQSFEEQTETGAASVVQRANSLNAVSTTLLPAIEYLNAGDGPGPRTICSVRTAGPTPGTAYLVNVNWDDFSSIDPPSFSTIPPTQTFDITFTTGQSGLRGTHVNIFVGQFATQFAGDAIYASPANTITTPQGNFSGDVVSVQLNGDCPSGFAIGEYDVE